MKIGVIVTGHVRESLVAAFGAYPAMFDRLLNGAGRRFSLAVHDVVGGEAPPAPDAADGWLVTGSRHGVYDDLPWIAATKGFLREARAARRPIVGVCFGHQIMAEAFGGRAEKFAGGWRLGLQRYEAAAHPWSGVDAAALRLHANHQDQVTAIPSDAAVWASNDGCRYAGLAYGDLSAPDAVSIQPHPEFAPDYARALISLLVEKGSIAPEQGAEAAATIGAPHDNAAVGAMLGDFLSAAVARRAAA